MQETVLLQLNGQDLQTLIAEAVRLELSQFTPPVQLEHSPDNETLLTQKEVADLLRTTKQTVIRWGQEGRLRPIRYGRSVRYKKGDVLKAVKGV